MIEVTAGCGGHYDQVWGPEFGFWGLGFRV
jgi:hypothetical protein